MNRLIGQEVFFCGISVNPYGIEIHPRFESDVGGLDANFNEPGIGE